MPMPQAGEVLVRVLACGVCRTDLHVSEGDLPVHRPHVTPGHEIVGQIVAIAPGSKEHARAVGITIGDRVGIAWLRSTCGACEYCLSGHENLCHSSRYTGWDENGGYAQYATAPIDYVYPLEALLRGEPAGYASVGGGAACTDSVADSATANTDATATDSAATNLARANATGSAAATNGNAVAGGNSCGSDSPVGGGNHGSAVGATAIHYTAQTIAPLLCAGIIGYRALKRTGLLDGIDSAGCKACGEPYESHEATAPAFAAGNNPSATRAMHPQPAHRAAAHAPVLGLYGFGGSAHITAQVALALGMRVHVLTRGEAAQQLALSLGCSSAAGAYDMPPEPLDAAIVFAPVGDIVPPALRALRSGGVLSLAGIHMSDIPALNYEREVFHEKEIRSVESNTRQDGREFLEFARAHQLDLDTHPYPLSQAQQALKDLKAGAFAGAAVLMAHTE